LDLIRKFSGDLVLYVSAWKMNTGQHHESASVALADSSAFRSMFYMPFDATCGRSFTPQQPRR